MSYDALQSNSVKQAIDALPQKDRDEFDGFTFYEDVLSHASNTRGFYILTKMGRMPYQNLCQIGRQFLLMA